MVERQTYRPEQLETTVTQSVAHLGALSPLESRCQTGIDSCNRKAPRGVQRQILGSRVRSAAVASTYCAGGVSDPGQLLGTSAGYTLVVWREARAADGLRLKAYGEKEHETAPRAVPRRLGSKSTLMTRDSVRTCAAFLRSVIKL